MHYIQSKVFGSTIRAKQMIDRQITAYLRRVEDVLEKEVGKQLGRVEQKGGGDTFRAKLNNLMTGIRRCGIGPWETVGGSSTPELGELFNMFKVNTLRSSS